MKVVFIGKSHEFSTVPLRALQKKHDIVGIIESAPRKSTVKPSANFKRTMFEWRERIGMGRSLRAIAYREKIAYLQLSQDNLAELEDLLRSVLPDIVCVASLSQLLPRRILDVPKYGIINLHPSLLPKYHGPFPWFWQYHDFTKEWGITVHALDEGQDTGPIIKQTPISIETGTDIADAISIVAPVGANLMAEAISSIENGTAVFSEQPIHAHPKARIVGREEKFIDWQTWSIERVWHFMRGTYPWNDAIAYPKEGLWRAGEYCLVDCVETPGAVCRDADGYFVAHPQGKIRVNKLETGALASFSSWFARS
ncbi:MAG: methionyl-tRNA formyltransferase [Burkholderiales bacterium]